MGDDIVSWLPVFLELSEGRWCRRSLCSVCDYHLMLLLRWHILVFSWSWHLHIQPLWGVNLWYSSNIEEETQIYNFVYLFSNNPLFFNPNIAPLPEVSGELQFLNTSGVLWNKLVCFWASPTAILCSPFLFSSPSACQLPTFCFSCLSPLLFSLFLNLNSS